MIRAIFLKDLRVLRRSPALLALVVLYPIVLAIGLGAALTRDPEPPRIGVVNLLPANADGTVSISGQTLSLADLKGSLTGGGAVHTTPVGSRADAIRRINAGQLDGALIVPADAARKLGNSLTTGGVSPGPTLEVLYRSSGPLDGTLVRALIAHRLRQAERALAREIVRVATGFLSILRDGGSFEVLGQKIQVLGLRSAELVVQAAASQLPPSQRGGLQSAASFARLARQNLNLSDDILRTIAQPLDVKETAVGNGGNRTLSGFAVGVVAALSLMLVAMTLGAGLLASERDEGTLRRLLRGGHGAWRIVIAKVAAAASVAAISTLLLLTGLAGFGAVGWVGAALWLPALLVAAAAFAAFGVLLGAGLRDARAATLAAILIAVPVVVIAVVPDQVVGGALGSTLDAISALLPFNAARHVLDAAVAGDGDGRGAALLAAQTATYTAAAGLLVRRARG